MIDLIINDQKSVVGFVECLNVDGSVLGIVPIDVQLELRRNMLGVDGYFLPGSLACPTL